MDFTRFSRFPNLFSNWKIFEKRLTRATEPPRRSWAVLAGELAAGHGWLSPQGKTQRSGVSNLEEVASTPAVAGAPLPTARGAGGALQRLRAGGAEGRGG